MDETVETLTAYCRENGRVCPLPTKWNELYEMRPNKRRVGSESEPPLPLILAAWWESPAPSKMARLAEHIEWAERHGCLDEVASYLRGLREKDWFHIGD